MAPTTSRPQVGKFDDGQIYIYACHHNTRKHRSPYISLENQTKLRMTIAPLDLSSGNAPDDGPRFVEPVPWDEMNDFVESTRPWETFSDLKPLREDQDVSKDPYARWAQSHRFHEGENMYRVLSRYAQEFPQADSLVVYTSPADLRSAYYLDYQWLTLSFTVSEDASKPHTCAFLTDSVPLRSDLLSTGETSVAFGLTKLQRLQDEYNSHRYIPATIFSASDRQIRIIQCWHDKQNPKALHIRLSPIMDFRDGARGNWKDWITVLCWIAGKPVGDTKNGSETIL